jgi:hypothetical protein
MSRIHKLMEEFILLFYQKGRIRINTQTNLCKKEHVEHIGSPA